MAEGSPSSPTADLFLFLALLGGLFVLWVATGGPNQTSGESGIFGTINTRGEYAERSSSNAQARPPAQVEEDVEGISFDVKRKLENLEENIREARIRGTASPYEGQVEIRGGRPKERFVGDEYIELSVSRNIPVDINITGWTLESVVTGQRVTIGRAARLPYPGEVNTQEDIVVNPGDRVIVASARSPIGVGFRVNLCTGYFEQFQNFAPTLRKQCPDPEKEFENFANVPVIHLRIELDEQYICRKFIDRNIDRCEVTRIDLEDVRPRLSDGCIDFIEETYTYQGCVANHQYDPGFYTGYWYTYIGKPFELWREKYEIIRLLDAQGRTVDYIDY